MPKGGFETEFDRSLIGHRSKPSVVHIETGQIKFFAKATDQRNPIYFDEAAARAAGYRAIVVPPTFGFSLTSAAKTSAIGFDQLRGDIRFLLHGEQGFRYHQLLYVEDDATITSEVVDMYEKKDGLLRFIVQRTVLTNQDDALCVESDSTFVLRSPELRA